MFIRKFSNINKLNNNIIQNWNILNQKLIQKLNKTISSRLLDVIKQMESQ